MSAVRTAPPPTARSIPTPVRPASRPPAGWYWLAAGIAIVGLASAAVWGAGGIRDYRQRIDGFARAAAPGQTTVQVSATGDRVVFYEGPGSPSLAQLGVQVTDPRGANVPVHGYQGDLRYDTRGGSVGHALGSFRAATAGTYRVRVAGGAAQGARVAVGESFVARAVANVLGVALLAIVTLGGSLALAVAILVRRSQG